MIVRPMGISSCAREAALNIAFFAVVSGCRSNVPSAAKLLYLSIWSLRSIGALWQIPPGLAIGTLITIAIDHLSCLSGTYIDQT
jgi:hypothetical protein